MLTTVNLIGAQIRLFRLLFVTLVVGLLGGLKLGSSKGRGYLLLVGARAFADRAVELNVGACACPHDAERIFVLLMHVRTCLELTGLGVITGAVGTWRGLRTFARNTGNSATLCVLWDIEVLLGHADVRLGLGVDPFLCHG